MQRVVTPNFIINKMFELIMYDGDITRSILVPVMNNGEIVISVLRKMIIYGREHGYTDSEIAKYIDANLYGIEYDVAKYTRVLQKMQNVLIQVCFEADCEFSNIRNIDVFACFYLYNTMDFVLCNSVGYKGITENFKSFAAKSELFEKGVSDYLYLNEFGIKCLKNNSDSHFIFLTSRSYIDTDGAAKFRDYIIQNNLVEDVVDFGTFCLQAEVPTLTSILHLCKQKTNTYFGVYKGIAGLREPIVYDISDFKNGSDFTGHFLSEYVANYKPLSDYCTIAQGISIKSKQLDVDENYRLGTSKYVLFNGFMIEREAVKPCYKVITEQVKKLCGVLFLYKFVEAQGKYLLMSDLEIAERFPKVFKYLQYYAVIYQTYNLERSKELDKVALIAPKGYKRLAISLNCSANIKKFAVTLLEDGQSVLGLTLLLVKDADLDYVLKGITSEQLYLELSSVATLINKTKRAVKPTMLLSYNLSSAVVNITE